MDMRNFYRRNLPVLLVLGIILALAGAGAAKQAAALPAGSWGLSFQQEGQPPVGNTTADRLRQYDAAFLGDTAQKRIYLTFDAGYENGCTAQILDALQKQTNIYARNTGHLGSYRRFKPKGVVSNTGTTFFIQ